MRNASLYRVGGMALLAGAVLNGVGVLLLAAQPLDLAAYGAGASGRWTASWLLAGAPRWSSAACSPWRAICSPRGAKAGPW